MHLALEIGNVDFERALLTADGEERRLRPLELRLLAYMAAHPEVVLSPDALLREVWGYADGVETRTLYATINRLRLALERDPKNPTHIKTVPRLGYRFCPLPRAAEPAPPPAVHPTPPPAWTTFVGRSTELERLVERSLHGRLVTVRGAAGVGKSRLAAELARRAAAAGRGVVWADLGHAHTDDDVVRAVAGALGLGSRPRDAAAAVAAALAGREGGLLVLDDADLAREALLPRLAEWTAAPGPTVVLTLRGALRAPGEAAMVLGPLGVPSGALDEGSESGLLLAARLHERQPDVTIAPSDPWVAPLLRALGGLPLAIELAAPWLLVMGGEELLEHVHQGLGDLRDTASPGPGRHRSIHDSLRWGWNLLAPWERAALAQCTTFRGPFDLRAARVVVRLDAWPDAPPVHDVLLRLVEHSWLRVEPRPIGQLFSFFAGQRAFVAGEPPENGAGDAPGPGAGDAPGPGAGDAPGPGAGDAPGGLLDSARARHLTFLTGLSAELDMELLYLVGGLEWQRLRARAADLTWAAEQAVGEDLVALAVSLGRVLLGEGPLEACVAVVDRALLVAAPPGPAGLRGRRARLSLRNYRAIALRHLGRPEEARAELEWALSEAGEPACVPERGRLLRAYGVLEMYHGDALASARHLERARLLHQQAGLVLDEAIAGAEAGTLAFLQGELPLAIDRLERALGTLREGGAGWVYGVYLANLGVVELIDDRLDSAARHLEEAVELNRRYDAVRFEALALGNLALVEERRGRYPQAHAHLDAAFALTRRTGDRSEEASLWSSRGLVALSEGRVDAAAVALERAGAMAESLAIPRLSAEVLTRRAAVAIAREEWAHAERMIERAAEIAGTRRLTTELIDAAQARIELWLAVGDRRRAEAALATLAGLPGVRPRVLTGLRSRLGR